MLRALALLPLAGLLGLSACSTLPRDEDAAPPPAAATAAAAAAAAEEEERAAADNGARDPLEGFNRAMYRFNEKFDKYFMKPVAQGYRAVLPSFVRQGIANFFNNLGEPVVIVNDLLQGKFRQGGSDLLRFVVNTTLGLGGLFDVASSLGLPKHEEDFGQTLAVWGVGEGPYLVLPIFGPSNFRDGFGLVVDYYLYPPTHMEETSTRDKLSASNLVSRRAQLLDATDILEQAGGEDPYVFVREFYRQRRRNQIYDGAPLPEVPEFLFEHDAPRSPDAGQEGRTPPGPPPLRAPRSMCVGVDKISWR